MNDYSPETIGDNPVGPWEMHGTWSLDLKGRSGLADFSAAMTMELSDHAMEVAIANGVMTGGVPSTFDNPETRVPHTHHITMKDATVSYNTSAMPFLPRTSYPQPRFYGHRLGLYYRQRRTGALFGKNDTVLSMLEVCVSGGTDVPFSNVTLVFGSPASGHFGPQAIHGVVRESKSSDSGEEKHTISLSGGHVRNMETNRAPCVPRMDFPGICLRIWNANKRSPRRLHRLGRLFLFP